MKNLLTVVFILSLGFYANAKQIDEGTARTVGSNFIAHLSAEARSQNAVELNLAYVARNATEASFPTNAFFFVFNVNHGGFVIVAADDSVNPILGYSKSGKFDPNGLPEQVAYWLDGYQREIEYAIQAKLSVGPEIAEKWNALKNGTALSTERNLLGVDPLLKTKWDQRPYVNALCPGGSVTGCGATAMAQVMKYWNYPAQGVGFHSYDHKTYGTISVNFANTTYNWGDMPNVVTGPNNSVATLMYHCGVSQDMDYTPQLSTSGLYSIRDALKTYFGYKPSLNSYNRADYSDATWNSLLKADLDNSRPIFYRGAGTGGGHFFVLDGYDNNNYYHINWGWGGLYDGYFLIDALNPGGVGTGGYNSGHYAILGIEPEQAAVTNDLRLYSSIEFNPNPIASSTPFTATLKIVNYSTVDFSGDFCAAIFTKAGVFVDYVEVKNGITLKKGFYNTYTFSSSGIAMIPGKYILVAYYRPPNKEWVLLTPNSYANPLDFDISGGANTMQLYSKMTLSAAPIVQNQAFNIKVDIVNYGTAAFSGWISAELYDKEGNWLKTIDEVANTVIPAGFYLADVQFNTAGLSNPPGTYYIALFNSPDYAKWTLVSNVKYENPITVNITAPGIIADKYENNNTKQTAYNLTYNFSGNSAVVNTAGSNLHNSSDYDFYKIVLPAGYDYEVAARLGDRFNKIDASDYDADVLFSYDTGTGFSAAFDFELGKKVMMKNGGTIIFYVSPYAAGITGNYILETTLTRTKTTSVGDVNQFPALSIYPNPASSQLIIDIDRPDFVLDWIEIFDKSGRLVQRQKGYSQNGTKMSQIDVSSLCSGSYIVCLSYENGERISRNISIIK